jgi:hypothetical protein
MRWSAGCLALVLAASVEVGAQAPPDWHVRSSDSHLADLIAQGYARSATFRRLVSTLNASDVIVYVEPQIVPRVRRGGFLIDTVVKAGPYRYLRIRVGRRSRTESTIAVLAHELQHAVEVAEAPEVRDSDSFRELFERIGLPGICNGACLETEAAMAVQRQVGEELQRSEPTTPVK